MRRSAGAAAAVALVGAALAGCITNEGTLQIAALQPVADKIREVEVGKLPVLRGVVGRDTRITSILLVPTFDGPSLERAAADALEKGGGDLLISAHVRTIDHWFLIGWSMIEVRGDVIDLRAAEKTR